MASVFTAAVKHVTYREKTNDGFISTTRGVSVGRLKDVTSEEKTVRSSVSRIGIALVWVHSAVPVKCYRIRMSDPFSEI